MKRALIKKRGKMMKLEIDKINENWSLFHRWRNSGKTMKIQYSDKGTFWNKTDDPCWDITNVFYREKPGSYMRDLIQDDIVNSKSHVLIKDDGFIKTISALNEEEVWFVFGTNKVISCSYKQLREKEIFINGKWQLGQMVVKDEN